MITSRRLLLLLALLMLLTLGAYAVYAWEPAVVDDPLVRMPGTQPNQVSLESPNRCLNCHAGYDTAVEPGYNWKGSMMAQSARDFLFWACMTVAAQDSIFAVGSPNATDICERCHFPKGWLEGRSDPTNASLMTGADYDGVQCDFCHNMYDPFFETTYDGSREGGAVDVNGDGAVDVADRLLYWDETNNSGTPSDLAALATYNEDIAQAVSILQFNGAAFFSNYQPPYDYQPPENYKENASGQYFVSDSGAKRASFADADARHQMLYSRYHKSKYFCATCHDVSNPVLANLGVDPAQQLTTEGNSAYSYFHVERTFSEFMLSDYGLDGGSPGVGPYAPDLFATSDINNNIRMCQDCHMRDVNGIGANKNGAVSRPVDSIEHPESGQPLHDMTGGNIWVSTVLASAVPGSPNYDRTNDNLLNKGPAVLTLDLTQGQGIDPVALLAGADRAREQLNLAAAIENVSYDAANGRLSFRIQNQTGHKLISGFPEGRRMFVNIQAADANGLIFEVNPYDPGARTLRGLDYPYQPGLGLEDPQPLGANEVYVDELVYEMLPTSNLTGEEHTFHFALATGRYKDNRIPPKGFRINEAADRHSVPVWHGVEDSGLYTAEEYAGGYDDVSLNITPGATSVTVRLFYQTTSREYIEFLRDEINGTGNLTLPATDYIIQTDASGFFDGLKAWGDTIWDLWLHNKDDEGAKPYLMAQATVGAPPPTCTTPTPTLLEAIPASNQVTINWSDEHTAAPTVLGYNVYYDQADKSQFLADAGLATTYNDAGLTNGNTYCYKVSAYEAGCESDFSNIICTTPQAGGGTPTSSVTHIETGRLVTSGKGKTQTTTLELTDQVNAGDEVVIRAYVVDHNGAALEGATVSVAVSGPENATLEPAVTNVDGVAELTWKTMAGKRNNPGTLPGTYTAAVTDVTKTGYAWDGLQTEASFTVK